MTAREPTLPVLIGLSSHDAQLLVAAGQSLPSSIWGTAYLDTGTNVTCVGADVLRQLGITAIGQGGSQSTGGQISVKLFEISLTVPPPGFATGPLLTRESLLVMELSTPIPGIDVLIGLDILLDCKFLLDGPARQFTLEF